MLTAYPTDNEDDECSWYMMNDSNVSFSTFASLKGLTKRFPRDAAYLLFYRKQGRPRSVVN